MKNNSKEKKSTVKEKTVTKKIEKENKNYLLILLLLIVFFCVFKKLNGFELLQPIDKFVENIFQNKMSRKFTNLVSFTSDFVGIYTFVRIQVVLYQ